MVSASSIPLMSYSLARHSPLPLLPLRELPSCLRVLGPAVGPGARPGQASSRCARRTGPARRGARFSRCEGCRSGSLCGALKRRRGRVAALGAGGCGGGRGGRGVGAGCEGSEGVWGELVGEGLGGCFRNLSGAARCRHCLRRLC